MALMQRAQPVVALRAEQGPAGVLRRFDWRALGTGCALHYVTEDEARGRAFEAAARAWVETFEARYSRYRPASALSRINAAAGGARMEIDQEMQRLLGICRALHFMTQGVLDATALPVLRLWDYRAEAPREPSAADVEAARRLVGWEKVELGEGWVRLPEAGMALDFGGWGKEYAVDAVAELARAHGIAVALVDFGRDLRVLGRPPGRPAWHVGLEDPRRPGECWGSIGVSDAGVATSGDYQRGFTKDGKRYGHIVDVRTGRPVTHDLRQVTVVAPSCMQAGVWATTAFVLGVEAGRRLVEEQMGVEACFVTDTARAQTRGFFRYGVEA